MNKADSHLMTLAELRKAPGQPVVKQAVVALAMQMQEPAISKIERKRVSDTSLDKLRRFVDAIGGEVSLKITLPNGESIDL